MAGMLLRVTIVLIAFGMAEVRAGDVIALGAAVTKQKMAATTKHRTAVLEFRAKVERHFRDPHLSPLTELDRENFTGLSYFEINSEVDLAAWFVAAADDSAFAVPTFNNKTLDFIHFGTLTVNHAGRTVRLKVFQRLLGADLSGTALIPFRDTTNGDETYAGGRYIELELPLQEPLRLDFNRAMNPWCAYDPNYACPIPPSENHLSFQIRAGEKRFK
jgi:uncharacterized protein (DUF1684 family)